MVTSVVVGGKIRDHKTVTATVPVLNPTKKKNPRQVWNYRDADWVLLNDTLAELDWDFIRRCSPDEGTARLTEIILHHANEIIGKRDCKDIKSTHPWLTEELTQIIKMKHDAEATSMEKEKQRNAVGR